MLFSTMHAENRIYGHSMMSVATFLNIAIARNQTSVRCTLFHL